jgi:hypothetical protein
VSRPRVYRTDYRGPTDHSGSRIIVTDAWENSRRVIPFDHSASDAHMAAVIRASGRDAESLVTGGWHKRGSYVIALE